VRPLPLPTKLPAVKVVPEKVREELVVVDPLPLPIISNIYHTIAMDNKRSEYLL